jgi:hypothetical protein
MLNALIIASSLLIAAVDEVSLRLPHEFSMTRRGSYASVRQFSPEWFASYGHYEETGSPLFYRFIVSIISAWTRGRELGADGAIGVDGDVLHASPCGMSLEVV